MKKIAFMFGVLCICVFCVAAQGLDTEKKYALRTTNTSLGFSLLHLTDNYLSPLPYSGIGLKLNTESRKFYKPESDKLSYTIRGELKLGSTLNPAQTASILYLGFDLGYGTHYHFRPAKNLQILAGGVWDIDLGFKGNLRNVNNPFSLDLATNINLSAVVIYDIQAKKRIIRLQGALESPLIGCMFVPEKGVSYYEIFMLRASGHYAHFSFLHNKLGLRQSYSVEIPFNNAKWRFGISSEILKYSANSLIFKRQDITLFVGYTRDLYGFTRKNPAPENFIGY